MPGGFPGGMPGGFPGGMPGGVPGNIDMSKILNVSVYTIPAYLLFCFLVVTLNLSDLVFGLSFNWVYDISASFCTGS